MSTRTLSRWSLIMVCLLTATVAGFAVPASRGKIVFVSDRDGNREIYVMNPDGSDQTRLTSNSLDDDHPSWSPDGRSIAFVRSGGSTNFAIWIMASDGSRQTKVTNFVPAGSAFESTTISWSPDGRKIVYCDFRDIITINTDGTGRTNLTDGRDWNYQPAWSPDGRSIVFGRSTLFHGYYPAIYQMDPDGSNMRLLYACPGYSACGYSDWKPDGSEIVFTLSYMWNEDVDAIAKLRVEPGATPVILLDTNNHSPRWSPDGTSIVFESNSVVWRMDATGAGVIPLSASGHSENPDWQPKPKRTGFDFEGDGKTDVSVYRPEPSGSQWWWMRSSDNAVQAASFGDPADVIASGDFTGDGLLDLTVWRPSTGYWYIVRSEDHSFYGFPFGSKGDVPATGDYDGDGKTDPAVFRASVGRWYISRSSDGQVEIFEFGSPGDLPVVADYDGDGRDDAAVFRPKGASGAEWWIDRSSQGVIAFTFGAADDKPVPGDYTGDGRADIAIWRPGGGYWYVLRSENNSYYAFPFGAKGDKPAPGDYDGDGKADPTVFRQAAGIWYINRSSDGRVDIVRFGQNGDKPIPGPSVP